MVQLTEFIQSVGSDVVFVLLLFGMWMAITAVYVPGLGFPEGAAVTGLALGVGGLIAFPVNVIGVLFLVLALGFLLALVYYRHTWWLIVAGFAAQLLGSFLLFRAEAYPSVLTLLAINAVSAAYFFIVLLPGLRIQDKPRKVGADALLGMEARVTGRAGALGLVRLMGETWRAQADVELEPGQWVRVVGREGLVLMVEPIEHHEE